MQNKCYFGCNLSGPLHSFPYPGYPHEERFEKWKSVLNEELKSKDNLFIHRNVRFCGRHFENKYKTRGRRLTANSVPTINLCTTAQAGISTNQTVLAEATSQKSLENESRKEPITNSPPPPTDPPSPPPGPKKVRRGWITATAVALTASVGGAYLLRKLNSIEQPLPLTEKKAEREENNVVVEGPPIPSIAEGLPQRVDYLVVGAGTAAFAALRTLRSVRPEASVLLVGDERALPYMRPPLNKELWQEPNLATRASDPDNLIFQQWNGKKRRLAYEPDRFYTPTEKLRQGAIGAGVARGWTVTGLDIDKHEATVKAQGSTATITYKKCLIATGARAKRLEALREVRASGRVLSLRSVRDVARLALLLQEAPPGPLAVLGGGAHASELAASLANNVRDSERTVIQVFKEATPLADQLPEYLAADVARRMQESGVQLLPNTEVIGSSMSGDLVRLERRGGEALEVALVVECVGSEPNVEVAEAAGLELHPQLGGIVVNAEMQARGDVWVAGDAACFHEPQLGRRRVSRHDHAVGSGRLAAANMAAQEPPRAYAHQPMLWTDLGPRLGLEAIGIIDSQLATVGVFSSDAVAEALAVSEPRGSTELVELGSVEPGSVEPGSVEPGSGAEPVALVAHTEPTEAVAAQRSPQPDPDPASKSYERGVVFYLREKRVVGVLLLNLFSRMHVARQVLKQGEFEDLFEVAKLFTPHEDD